LKNTRLNDATDGGSENYLNIYLPMWVIGGQGAGNAHTGMYGQVVKEPHPVTPWMAVVKTI